MKILSSLIIAFIAHITLAQTIEGEIELTGFIVGQYRKAVHSQFGKPLQRMDTGDGWIYEFHAIEPDTSVYALFKYPVWDTLRIYSIQLNGHQYHEMHPFKGLKLGADKTQIDQVLGAFNHTDTIDNPTVIIQFYENKNYSVEVDEKGKLYGIQIYGSIQGNKPTESMPSIEGFTNAILTKNVDSLLLYLMPDVELYVDNKVVTYAGAARDEFKRKESELVKYLLGKKESVHYAFSKEKAEATPELRLFTEKKMTTTVYKFYQSNILSEIVFMPHAGRWKVYEITFKK